MAVLFQHLLHKPCVWRRNPKRWDLFSQRPKRPWGCLGWLRVSRSRVWGLVARIPVGVMDPTP